MIEFIYEGVYRVIYKVIGIVFEFIKDGEIVFYIEVDWYDSVKGKFKGEVIGIFE